LDASEHVVNGVAYGLQIDKIFVFDAEPYRAFAQLFFEGFDQLDQGQRIGIKVVDQTLAFCDTRRVDLEDVTKVGSNDLENGCPVKGPLLYMRLSGHDFSSTLAA
jgi:hypothetical protein